MAIQPGSLSLEQRMKMLADEQATRSAKSKGLRTGASPPPQPSPTLQSTLNVRDRIGSAIDTGKWGYPPSPKGSVGPNSSIGTPVEKTVKLHETGAYNWPPAKSGEPSVRVVPGSPADARSRSLGQPVASGGAAPNPEMSAMMLARERTPFSGPTLAGKMANTQTSPIMPTPGAPAAPSPTAMGPNVDPREFDNRMAMLKREIIGNRAAAMGQPLDMDRWKLTPEQRAQQYATKANAALNISELNRAGQDMTRARNPVASSLATPDQAAQSQQELLKASGQFGAFGPEPDLAMRSQLLAKEMAPRRANAERMDAEAAARDSARAGDFREMEGRDRTQRANAEKLGEAELAARIGMLESAPGPDLARRAAEAKIKMDEAQARATDAQVGTISAKADLERQQIGQSSKMQSREAEIADPGFAPAKNAAAQFHTAVNALSKSMVRGGVPVIGASTDEAMRPLASLRSMWPNLSPVQRQEIINDITTNILSDRGLRGMSGKQVATLGSPLGTMIDAINRLRGADDDVDTLMRAVDQMRSGSFGSAT